MTGVDGVYAIGDVVPGFMLAHVAMYEGEVALDNITGHYGALTTALCRTSSSRYPKSRRWA